MHYLDVKIKSHPLTFTRNLEYAVIKDNTSFSDKIDLSLQIPPVVKIIYHSRFRTIGVDPIYPQFSAPPAILYVKRLFVLL